MTIHGCNTSSSKKGLATFFFFPGATDLNLCGALKAAQLIQSCCANFQVWRAGQSTEGWGLGLV